jgi:GNAT superfamily N-acetyltransferase
MMSIYYRDWVPPFPYIRAAAPLPVPTLHVTDQHHPQLEYRLRTCGELCSGLFASAYATSPGPLGALTNQRKFQSVDSSDADRKRLLLAHIIATKHTSPLVTDDAMDFPSDWRTRYQLSPSTGHNEDGETVCLHSLCVHPDFHAKGIGAILLRGWTMRIKDAGVGKRIALICRERLVPWYEKAGFEKVGPSQCQYGGGGWIDMVMEFDKATAQDDDF